MKTNTARPRVTNHEGVAASAIPPIEQLRRTVLACMLWEAGFYEDGVAIADRIRDLVAVCNPFDVSALAVDARTRQHLRHVPLLLVRELARTPARCEDGLIASTIDLVIQRADEPAELLSLYWQGGDRRAVAAGRAIPHQMKVGLARALQKFDAYQLGKWKGAGKAIRLRDVLFLTHAKPRDEAQAALWKQLADDTLPTPDTWETSLSAGADKRATFERLIAEGRLGYVALLRNLRNMHSAGVPLDVVAPALLAGAARSRVLPFRFIAAARAVPAWESAIEAGMMTAVAALPKLPGRTIALIDVSPSMNAALSTKSDLTRRDAAGALAILLRGICDDVRVFAFSSTTGEVPPRRGMALLDAIGRAVRSDGTLLGAACRHVAAAAPSADRLIVFTDEESQDPVPAPHVRGYLVNVATSERGVGYSDWLHINGFSEAVVQYIAACEGMPAMPAGAAPGDDDGSAAAD
jgi:60 kDa SS-A/Ro ribonucleoprotein